jgi:hypothetical protein
MTISSRSQRFIEVAQSPGCTRVHVHQAVHTIQLHPIAGQTDDPLKGSKMNVFNALHQQHKNPGVTVQATLYLLTQAPLQLPCRVCLQPPSHRQFFRRCLTQPPLKQRVAHHVALLAAGRLYMLEYKLHCCGSKSNMQPCTATAVLQTHT